MLGTTWVMASVKEQLASNLHLPVTDALKVRHFPDLRPVMRCHLCRSRLAKNGIPNRCFGFGIELDFAVAKSDVNVHIRVIAETAVHAFPGTMRVRGTVVFFHKKSNVGDQIAFMKRLAAGQCRK